MNLATFIQQELNDHQRTAVLNSSGPLLVIAGAGSGKTRVITARIAHLLINHHTPAHEIVALTFTNKAAREMLERVTKFIVHAEQHAPSSQLPFIGTFHSFCLKLLREHTAYTNMPRFSIMDADDQLLLIKKLIEKHCPKKVIPRHAMYAISAIKNGQRQHTQNSYSDTLVNELHALYEREKSLCNCLDFDDLLIKAQDLFKHDSFKSTFQNRVRHILVDEYQDTNIVQHNILKEMALQKKTFAIDSLCAVGDEDQSIYSWRGATVDNIINFAKDFPTTERIKIEQNYRSAKSILDAANSIITHNTQRHPKNLWSTRSGLNAVALLHCSSEFQEADVIAHAAQMLHTHNKLGQAAVLYRTHFQSRIIEEALIKQSIPYQIIGGIQFYERKEIKDMLAYLRLLVNPYDRIAFQRIINCPPRRLGDKFLDMITAIWDSQPLCTYQEVTRMYIQQHSERSQQTRNVANFLSLFDNLVPEILPSQAIEKLARSSSYYTYLKDEYESQEAETRIENIHELINAARHFETQGLETVEQFLQEVALVQEHPKTRHDEKNYLQLMTLHAAKGLEFDTVFLSGLEDGILPSSKSLESISNIEEERRLLYVGITRARNKLLLLQAEKRYAFGTQTNQDPSRFLSELPESGITRERCAFWKLYQTSHFLQHFLAIPSVSDMHTFQPTTVIQQQHAEKHLDTSQINMQKNALNKNSDSKTWKIKGAVQHSVFGIGIIQSIEKRPDGTVHITAQFKAGVKKIAQTFLKVV
jgi:DNA helicase II / ATP-dependent DNA helicase PcrA